MKLTAKLNGVQQEIELTKEDVYVVECGGVDETNSILKFIDESFKTTFYWKYVSNSPVFEDAGFYSKHVTKHEPIPPNTPIISFEDWERLMESDKEEPKPTQKWEKLTRGGLKYNILREDRGDGMMNVEHYVGGVWQLATLYKNGKSLDGYETIKDLIPLNRESILKEIEEHKQAIVELEKKLL